MYNVRQIHTSFCVGSKILNYLFLPVPSSLKLLQNAYIHNYVLRAGCSAYLNSFLFNIFQRFFEGSIILSNESPLQVQSLQKLDVSVFPLSHQQRIPLSHQSLGFLDQIAMHK